MGAVVMLSRATTTVTIFRGQAENEWGDNTDQNTIVGQNIPASLLEQSQYFRQEITTQPTNIRFARCRLGSEIDVHFNDRIQDETTGITWTIRNMSNYQNPIIKQDTRLDLQFTGIPS